MANKNKLFFGFAVEHGKYQHADGGVGESTVRVVKFE